MYYERLVIEPLDDGWIRFSSPDRPEAAESADGLLLLRPGFAPEVIGDALRATGCTEERDGQWSIQNSTSCLSLVRLLDEMLSYFDGPSAPSRALLEIKEQIDALLVDDTETAGALSLWHYARLDLLFREDLADLARSLTGVWDYDTFTLDARRCRSQRIDELRRQRFLLSNPTAQRMTASARTPANAQEPGKSAG